MVFQTGNFIAGRWQLQEQISESDNYQIFTAIADCNTHVILKITKKKPTTHVPHIYTLKNEYKILLAINELAEVAMELAQDNIPIVKPISFVTNRNYSVMTLPDLIGSVDDFLQEHPLNYRLTYLAGYFMVQALELTHRAGYIHMDVNPSHIIAQMGDESLKFLLGGFRHAVRFVDLTSTIVLQYIQSNQRSGDVLFSSANAMSKYTCGPRDGMESLGYCLVYMLRRKLPWSGLDEVEDKDRIMELKQPAHREQLCARLGVLEKYFDITDKSGRNPMLRYGDLTTVFREYIEKTGGMERGFNFKAPIDPTEGFIEE